MKMLWYFVLSFLFLCLEPMVGKYIWIRTTYVTVTVIFRESYLITAMFEFLSQQLWGTLTAAFSKTPCNWRFYGNGWTYVLILSLRLEQTWKENRKRCMESYKLQPAFPTTLHQNKSHFIYFYSLLFLSNKTSFWM